MPRVINKQYHERYLLLRMRWTEPGLQGFFALLPVADQREIHGYHRPYEDLDETSFDEHRRQTDQAQPSQVHRAGKYFRLTENTFTHLSKDCGITQDQMQKALSVVLREKARASDPTAKVWCAPIVNPEIDCESLARARLALARSQTACSLSGRRQ
jgi:hypothetical protein